MRSVYLDHTATTPLDPDVLEAMRPYFNDIYGNASSIHQFGREARAALDRSRETIAGLVGAKAGEIFFTSGGTEADNAAILGVAARAVKSGKRHVITSGAEHHAVLSPCRHLEEQGCAVSFLEVDQHGAVDPELVRKAIRTDTCLVSIMHANNEVGTINPVEEISAIAREYGIAVHTDAVQSFGRLPLHVDDLGLDLMTLSAHKMYGPKGIGALYLRRGIGADPVMLGGGQERGRRAGTENVAAAVGFARAAELQCSRMQDDNVRLLALTSLLRESIVSRISGIVVNGHPERSLTHILNVSFDASKIEIDGEALLFNLDLAGIAVTSGSACTSGSMEPSHVLLAMGRTPGTAQATIRFSLGRSTTRDDVGYTVDRLEEIVRRIGVRRN